MCCCCLCSGEGMTKAWQVEEAIVAVPSKNVEKESFMEYMYISLFCCTV